MCALFYFTTVPMIKSMAFEMEEKAGRVILNNFYLLIEQSHADLESLKTTALNARKRELRHLVELVVSDINAEVKSREGFDRNWEETKRRVLEKLRYLRYGQQQDYIWVADYNSRLISHPDPRLNGKDFSNIKDVKGNLIVPSMVKGALAHVEGYYRYWWRRLGRDEPIEKLSYYRNLPSFGWVIGTGVYIDDFRKEVEARKNELLNELRSLIYKTKVAGEGYLYIFDSNKNMIIHPNPNIENTNFSKLLDPSSKKPIADELIKAARMPGGKLAYMWDKPTDPGNYIYKKVAWVRYFPGFDWYIVISVYNKDLEKGAVALTRRIVIISLGALLFAIIGGYLFVRAFTTPIARMAESANRISKGELSSIELEREDEIGLLAEAFNNMVVRMKDQIRHLEARVDERTGELSGHLTALKERNKEIETINYMGDMFQACHNPDEIYSIMIDTIEKLFPESAGQIMELHTAGKSLEVVASWGDLEKDPDIVFKPDDCWSIRRGKTHYIEGANGAMTCLHIKRTVPPSMSWICIPMSAQGEIFGVLHTRFSDKRAEDESRRNRHRVLETVAEQAALSLSNIRLQQRLREQSIKDALTGLYNRRYTQEVMKLEQKRADRQGDSIGVLLMDIDNFKKINDTFGHDAGDEVLKRIAGILGGVFRANDTICRYGGEEFLVIMPGTESDSAIQKAEAMRDAVEHDLKFSWHGEQISVTVSIGVASYPFERLPISRIIDLADKALYKAKKQGRNRVETFSV